MIRVEDLTYTYPKCGSPILRNVSLDITEGDFILLVGTSGCGKSTLCRAFNGLIPHFYGGTYLGKVTVDGVDMRDTSPALMAETVGMVFQDPENQLVMTNVENEMAFGMENLGVPRSEMLRRVRESAEYFDLKRFFHRFIPELSGGEKQKVALGSVLAMSPKYLVLDEPTSQLDIRNSNLFLDFVSSLNQDFGVGVVIVEHRIERCMDLVKRMVVMRDGEIVIDGDPMDAYDHMREMDLIHDIRRDIHGYNGNGEAVVRAHDLHFSYGENSILQGLDFEARKGDMTVIAGLNGTGKSTFLKILTGLLTPSSGRIEVLGKDVTRTTVAGQARKVGYLSQNPNDYLFEQTLERELQFTLRNLGIDRREWEERIRWTLEMVDLTRYRMTFPRDLSTGERERAALATILVGRPDILVLDEPTRGLDLWMKGQLGRVLASLRDEGITTVLVTHDYRFIAENATRIYHMENGMLDELEIDAFLRDVEESARVIGG